MAAVARAIIEIIRMMKRGGIIVSQSGIGAGRL